MVHRNNIIARRRSGQNGELVTVASYLVFPRTMVSNIL